MQQLERKLSTAEQHLRVTNAYISSAATEILDVCGRIPQIEPQHPHSIMPVIPKNLAPDRSAAATVLPRVQSLELYDTTRWFRLGSRALFHMPRTTRSRVEATVIFPPRSEDDEVRTAHYGITTDGTALIDGVNIGYAWTDAKAAPSHEEVKLHFAAARRALGVCSLVLQSATRLAEFEPRSVQQHPLMDLYESMHGGDLRCFQLWSVDPVKHGFLPALQPPVES